MSELPTPRWDPSKVLHIVTASNDIFCAGITQKGLPCGYNLDRDFKLSARHLLSLMSQMSPREACDVLPRLARLCLCQKNHQPQAERVVADWTAAIETYASSLERVDTQQIHWPVGYGGNAGGVTSNGSVHATEPKGAKLSFHEIVAELNALSIRQEELKLMLQNGRQSQDGSPWTSPVQNIPHLVNQTQLSESKAPRAGQSQGHSSPLLHKGWRRFFQRGKHYS